MKSRYYYRIKASHYMCKFIHYNRKEKHPVARYIIMFAEDWR